LLAMHEGCIFLSGGGLTVIFLELEDRLSAKRSPFVTEHRAGLTSERKSCDTCTVSLRMHVICGAGSQSPVRVLKHMPYPERPESRLQLVA
jgi:hypothetical protein